MVVARVAGVVQREQFREIEIAAGDSRRSQEFPAKTQIALVIVLNYVSRLAMRLYASPLEAVGRRIKNPRRKVPL